MNADSYCVYQVKHEGKIVYVGSGKEKRPAHVNSGHSHNPNLNRHFFLLGPMAVEIVAQGLSKTESLQIELNKITLLYPEYNVKKRKVAAPPRGGFRSKGFGWLHSKNKAPK